MSTTHIAIFISTTYLINHMWERIMQKTDWIISENQAQQEKKR